MSYMKMLNGAFGTLASGIDTDDTTINLTGGHGSRFPSLAAGQCFVATLSNKPANKRETVLVTARSTDTLTVIRAFGDSTAKDWASNDRISIRWDRTMAMQYALVGGMSEYLQGGGSADAITATLDTLQTTLIDGMRVFVEITTGKNTGNATFTLSFDRTEWGGGVTSGTTKTLSRSFVSAVPLVEGDIPGTNFVAELVYSAAIDRWVLVNPAHGGLARQYREGVDDDFVRISGGNADAEGAYLILYGQSHADNPSDIQSRSRVVQHFIGDDGNFTVVKDEDDSVILRIQENNNTVEGTAVTGLAEALVKVEPSHGKILTPRTLMHAACVPTYILRFTLTLDDDGDQLGLTENLEIGPGSVSASYDNANNRLDITFSKAFANTNFLNWPTSISTSNNLTGAALSAAAQSTTVLRFTNVTPQGVANTIWSIYIMLYGDMASL